MPEAPATKPSQTQTTTIAPGYVWLMGLCVLALLLQALLSAQRDGDLIGYVNAGNAVLAGTDIYRDYLNTWPPFFSLIAVPLALGYQVAPYLTKVVWLLGNLLALFFTMHLTVSLLLQKNLLWPFQKGKSKEQIPFHHPLVLIPFLLVFRVVLEHLGHLQINLYIMLLAMLSVYFFYQKKPGWAGVFLGLSIAIKVYTVLILLFFLYKRAYRTTLYTLITVLLCVALTAVFFGFNGALNLHEVWWTQNATQLKPASHMNQSLLATALRYFTVEDTGLATHVNAFSLAIATVKKGFYVVIFLLALVPAFLFREKLLPAAPTVGMALQWGIIFGSIPLLSPVAWKYYYVFMWLPYFLINLLLFHIKVRATKKYSRIAKGLFYLSLLGITFSSELFVGPAFSDELEAYGIVTWGGVALVSLMFLIYLSLTKAQRNSLISEIEAEEI